MRHALSILQVNKQIRTEALEKYYGCNRFSFIDMGEFGQFVSVLRRDSKEHIVHLSLNYGIGSNPTQIHYKKYFRQLLELKYLTHLSMTIYEDRHLSKYYQVEYFPGFQALQGLRGIEELNFEGSYTRTKKYLEPLLLRPRPKPRAKNGPNTGAESMQKRKLEDDEYDTSDKKTRTTAGGGLSRVTRSVSKKPDTSARTQHATGKTKGTATAGRKSRAKKV